MNRNLELDDWLSANVANYDNPKLIILSQFHVNWSELSGSFVLSLDAIVVEPRITFGLDSNGWVKFWFPMHHSPLGVPASYSMFNLNAETENAINEALRDTFGSFRPLGLNKDINRLITGSSSLSDRELPNNLLKDIQSRIDTENFKYETRISQGLPFSQEKRLPREI